MAVLTLAEIQNTQSVAQNHLSQRVGYSVNIVK